MKALTSAYSCLTWSGAAMKGSVAVLNTGVCIISLNKSGGCTDAENLLLLRIESVNRVIHHAPSFLPIFCIHYFLFFPQCQLILHYFVLNILKTAKTTLSRSHAAVLRFPITSNTMIVLKIYLAAPDDVEYKLAISGRFGDALLLLYSDS